MSSAGFPPNIDCVETPAGVRYLLRISGSGPSNLALGLGFVLRIPLVAAGLALWFLWQYAGQVSPALAGLAGLFVAQMLFVARLPWVLLRQNLWQQLIVRFGHGEIELAGDRLFSGNRVGFLRSGQNRDLGTFQRVVIYVYQDASIPPAERAVLAIETSAKSPWLLVDGFSRPETLTLADDLQRRINAFRKRHASQSLLPQPVVIETDERALYPPLAPEYYRRRKPWWIGLHLAGCVGLAALTAIAVQGGAWQNSPTKAGILLGWLLEALLVLATLSLAGTTKSE